ncbi:MAG: acyl-CoA dehydrogenase family protein, partial [Candidatus Eisenbacteria bacterium]|nr:acyl-CoA dehydrogenase family protein [Candidatus Eisenbacteria bacterium]
MDLTFNDEERMVIELAREFAENELRPRARQLDEEGRAPRDLLAKMAEIGLFGLVIPAEYDGAGVSTSCYIQVIEELSRVCAAVAITLSVHNSVGAYPIVRFGTDAQKQTYLPKMAGGAIGAFCLSEAGSGSDAASLRCKATKDGDHYVIDGAKLWVTNGSIADVYLVMARTADVPEAPHRGISAFLVDRNTPGVTVGKLEDKMGIRASDTAEVRFAACRVPASSLLGKEGEGFKMAMMALDNGRIGVGSQAVGIAQGAFEAAVKYANEREQFGKKLIEHQAVAFMIADMDTQIAAARNLVRHAASLKDAGQSFIQAAAMAKLYASQAATRVAHSAVQVHGGYGFVKE